MGMLMEKVKARCRATLHYCKRYPELSLIWVLVAAAIALNAITLLRKYDYWSRIYAFGLVTLLWAIDAWILYSLTVDWQKAPLRADFKEFLSTPILVMAVVFCSFGIIGFLYFLYFGVVFRNCDRVIRLYTPEQVAADNIYTLTVLVTLPSILIYLVQRIELENSKLNMVRRHLIFAAILLLFVKIGVEEAYHTYEVVCRRRKELHKSCPLEHEYSCNTTTNDITESQRNWLEIDESLIRPGIFLVIAELLPLFFAFHWEITRNPVSHTDENHGLNSDAVVDTHEVHRHARDSADAALLISRRKVTVCTVLVLICAPLMLFRIGLRLNWIGFYPDVWAVELDRVGRIISAGSLLLLFIAAFQAYCTSLRDFRSIHLIHHSYLDRKLLYIAASFSTLLYLIRVISYYSHKVYTEDGSLSTVSAGLEVIGEMLQIVDLWVQILLLRAFLSYEEHLLRHFGKKGFILVVSVAFYNLLEWISVFMRRRFMHFILLQDETPYGIVVTAAVTEPFYPAIGFYYFHSVMCWTMVAVRFVKMGMFSLGLPTRRASQ